MLVPGLRAKQARLLLYQFDLTLLSNIRESGWGGGGGGGEGWGQDGAVPGSLPQKRHSKLDNVISNHSYDAVHPLLSKSISLFKRFNLLRYEMKSIITSAST